MSKAAQARAAKQQRRNLILTIAVAAVAIVAAWSFTNRANAQVGPPDFTMVAYQGEAALGGSTVDFRDLLGRGQPVVLNFWAGACPPCRQEMPGFQRLHDELGDQFLLVGVDVGPFVGLGTHEQAQTFLREYDIRYPTAFATSVDPVRDYEVRGMPTTLFMTSDGTIVYKHTGYLPEDRMRQEILALVAGAQ